MGVNLEKQTRKTFDDWIKIAEASKLSKAREITNFLKSEHGLTFGYANVIAPKTFTKRLELSGSFNSMVSHRVRVTSKEEVDKELTAWLRKAYDQA